MKCLNCNYEFDETNATCPACGSNNIEITSEDSSVCPNCHASLNGTLKCKKCGYDPEEEKRATVLSEEQQEKVQKVTKVVGIMAVLFTVGPFIETILLVVLGIIVFLLVGKGLLYVDQLVSIVKVFFVIVPIILALIFFKYKKDDEKPILRLIFLIIAILFVICIIIYNIQPVFKFGDYGSKTEINQDGYTIPTIQSIYQGKPTNSFRIKETETKGNVYTVSYEGALPDEVLSKYIGLLESQGYIKVDTNETNAYYYAKYDGKYSLCIEIYPNEPFNYTKCHNDDCVTEKIRNEYKVQYWFIPGNYSNYMNN